MDDFVRLMYTLQFLKGCKRRPILFYDCNSQASADLKGFSCKMEDLMLACL